MYSKFLVATQFMMIFAMLTPKKSVELFQYWWIFSLISAVTAIWIFTHNKIGNFNIVPDIKDGAKLVVTGPYRYVRHPMYSSLILFMFGFLLYRFNTQNLIYLAILIVAVILKALKEERLWKINDSSYHSYMQKTKMIIPFVI